MTTPLLIGLCGYKRSGKTTVANLLAEHHGFRVESFAAPIRRAVADILGYSPHQLEELKEQPVPWLDGITPRQLMQTLGTEWGRGQHEKLWLRSLHHRMLRDEIDAGGDLNWVVHDVRFPNEAEAIRAQGGWVVRVDRGSPVQADGHASEVPLPANLVDANLPNHGTRQDLAAAVDRLLAVLRDLERRAAVVL